LRKERYMAEIKREEIGREGLGPRWVYRAKEPGGWLVAVELSKGGGITFVPDPDHDWE